MARNRPVEEDPLSTPTSATTPSGARTAGLRAGFLAALSTWAVTAIPALVGWLAAPESSVSWFSAVEVGTSAWFLGHGQAVRTDDLTISLVPLLLLLVFVVIARRFAGRLLQVSTTGLSARKRDTTVLQGSVPGFLGGYVGFGVLVSVLTVGAEARPSTLGVVGTLLVPVAALGWLLLRPDEETAPAAVRDLASRGPSWLPAAWRVGWRGMWLLLLLGLLVALLRLGWSFDDVRAVHVEYGLGFWGGLVVVLAQSLFAGNIATWALAFLAGPGFQVATDSVVSPGGSTPGLMPLVPVLAALPGERSYPVAMWLVVLLPVLVGALIARRLERELEFFGNARARFSAAGVASLVAVGAVGTVTAIGNGALGTDRLSAIGPAVLPFVLALGVEVLLGALAFAGIVSWRESRPPDSSEEGGVVRDASADGAASDRSAAEE